MRRLGWSKIVSGAVLALLMGVLAKNVAAGSATSPRQAEMKRSERTEVPVEGVDERAPPAGASSVCGSGVVEPADRETKAAGQVGGRIARIDVKEGDIVGEEDPIAELESGNEKAQLAAAEGDLLVMRATLTRTVRGLRREDIDAAVADAEAAKERARLSAGTLARTAQLAETASATPDELDRAVRQAATDDQTWKAAEARREAAVRGGRSEDVVVADAQVAAATARRDQARATLERLTIRSPIRGQVLQLKFRAGEYYNPLGSEPLAVIGDMSKLRVRTDVDERDVGRVRLGEPAFVALTAFPGRKFAGHVVEIGRRMGRKNVRTDDPTERIDTKILEVVIDLDDREDLVPGMRVTSYLGAP
jgi:HlyD family secretion protein